MVRLRDTSERDLADLDFSRSVVTVDLQRSSELFQSRGLEGNRHYLKVRVAYSQDRIFHPPARCGHGGESESKVASWAGLKDRRRERDVLYIKRLDCVAVLVGYLSRDLPDLIGRGKRGRGWRKYDIVRRDNKNHNSEITCKGSASIYVES